MAFNYAYLIQVTSASISLIASVVIIIMIKRARLTTPYRRLIFCLCAADLLHSLGMAIGPFASPKGMAFASWAFGNTQTCTLNGFFNVAGSLGVALYLLTLSMYYYLKLNRRMTDAVFSRAIEKKVHFLIILFILVISIAAFDTTSFNPIPSGSICHLSRFPAMCWLYPEIVGECSRGGNRTIYLIYVVNFGVVPLSLIGVSVFMVLLIRNSIFSERIYTLNTGSPVQRRSQASNIFSRVFFCCFEKERRDEESNADYILRVYRRETVIQASLYIGSFLLTNLLMLVIAITNLIGAERPDAYMYISSFLYPFMGFFNMLIYCRPKVQWFRFGYPEVSWFVSFLLVIKAGGEVPSLANDPNALKLCCLGPQEEEVNRNPPMIESILGELDDSSIRDEFLSEISQAFEWRDRNQEDNANS